jgi:hypothetical protein
MNETSNHKVGDKVTIVGVGIAYVRQICGNGYSLYIVNQKRCGDGWLDRDLRPGWVLF